MKQRELLPVGAPSMSIRLARFEDVSGILRLIERALEHGCRDVYNQRQRRSVYLGYASSLFIEALGPFETLVAEMGGRLVGATQIDPRTGLLRALFVDAGFQGQGVGHALLAAIESRVPRPARSRAYASPAALPRPSQGSLPVGADSPFAGRDSHPLDDIPNFMNSSHDSLLSDQNFLVALKRLGSSRRHRGISWWTRSAR